MFNRRKVQLTWPVSVSNYARFEMSQLVIKSSVPTPYEISILFLIFLHLNEPKLIPRRLFLRLISSSSEEIPPFDIIKGRTHYGVLDDTPLLPTLDDILQYLHTVNHSEDGITSETMDEKVIAPLCKALKDIKFFDRLLTLQHVLDLHYKYKGNGFFDLFVQKCSKKFQTATFDERMTLMTSLNCFVDQSEIYQLNKDAFDNTLYNLKIELNIHYSNHHIDIDPINKTECTTEIDRGDPMLSVFKKLIKKTTPAEMIEHFKNDVLISDIHFQNIINYQIHTVIRSKDLSYQSVPSYQKIDNFLKKLTLNDITTFPSIHILYYFIYVKEHRYQDALNKLHTYYDYMLARNMDKNFHVSLFHLGLFHLHFNDNKSPMAAFEEAFKIAREHRDINTLNYIHLAILSYAEDYPREVFQLRNQINKIINSLQALNCSNDAQLYEEAYRAETLLSLRSNNNVIKLLENSFQYLLISLQQQKDLSLNKPPDKTVFPFYSKIWKSLGYDDISDAYEQLYEKEPLDKDIESGFDLLSKQSSKFDALCGNIQLPSIKHDQEMKLQLLMIEDLLSRDELEEALEKLDYYINDPSNQGQDGYWKFQYTLKMCQVFIKVNMGHRILPILSKLITETRHNKNGLQSAQCLLVLCQVLFAMNKKEEVYQLMKNDLDSLLQFNETKTDATKLFIEVADSLMMT